jgi:very-short-patch-repair endonuclease/DNA polymerase III delta prime subunit
VLAAIEQWRTKLLQLDRRNALLYFASGKRGVEIVVDGTDRFFKGLTKRGGLTFDYAERSRKKPSDLFALHPPAAAPSAEPAIDVQPGDLETTLPPLELQKRLATLYKRSREWQEEQGLNVLSLACGFLRWVDEDQEPAYSPLLLLPSEMKRKSPREPFCLMADGEEELSGNPTLQYRLATTAGVELPEYSEQSVEEYWDQVEQMIVGRKDWAVDRIFVLSTFPFSKLAMWADLGKLAAAGVANPLIRRLAGDGGAEIPSTVGDGVALPPSDEDLQGARLDSLLDVRSDCAVVDADFSQLRAIELARSGAHLVIHGPPGTGKSQTIANIIATLLASGKRVLFVSEKTAALDVVKRRLNDVGLGTFCLDLHSDRSKKASVYAQLKSGLEPTRRESDAFPYDRYIARRDELNGIVRALHEVRQPMGRSVFDVHGLVAGCGAAPTISIEVNDLTGLDEQRLRHIQDAAAQVARRPDQFRDHALSRWHALGAVSSTLRLAETIRSELLRIEATASKALDIASELHGRLGVCTPDPTLPELGTLIELLDHLEAQGQSVPGEWTEDGGLSRADEVLTRLQVAIEQRTQLLSAIGAVFADVPTPATCSHWLPQIDALLSDRPIWGRVVGDEGEAQILSRPEECRGRYVEVSSILGEMASLSRRVNQRFMSEASGVAWPDLARARLLADTASRIGSPMPAWDSVDGLTRAEGAVDNAIVLLETLLARENGLAERFEPELLDHVTADLQVRYKTDYRSPWRWLSASYRRDHRMLRGHLKRPGRLGLDEALYAVQQALTVQRLRREWRELEPVLSTCLGERFLGRETPLSAVREDLAAVRELYAQPLLDGDSLGSILRDTTAMRELRAAHDTFAMLQTRLDAVQAAPVERMGNNLEAAASGAELANQLVDFAIGLSGTTHRVTAPLRSFDQIRAALNAGLRLSALYAESTDLLATASRMCEGRFAGWETDCTAIRADLEWMQQLSRLLGTPIPERLARAICGGDGDKTGYSSSRQEVAEALAALRQAMAAALEHFPEAHTPWGSWERVRLPILQAWCEDLSAHADEAADWIDYRRVCERLDSLVGAPVVTTIHRIADSADDLPRILLRSVCIRWLSTIYQQVPELNFAPRDIDSTLAEFRTLDAKRPRAARERVKRQCGKALEGLGNMAGMGEFGVLTHQLSLSRRQLPVRKLIEKIPNLLLRIKPCFMMSPLAVSQFLPSGFGEADTLAFDAVVFDEASQVFPEDAIPALARGRQAIVVGDQQQLPPSNFFRNTEEDAEEEDEEEADSDGVGNRLRGVESVLDALVGMRGAGVADVDLKVHYRSQHDALIRYSNHYFYEDKLLTFPASGAQRPGFGLHSVYLSEGRFEAGGSRTNRVEAQKVADLVLELMASQPDHESIGVVALSRAQADLITDLINQRRLVDRRYDDRFADERHERFFVKNLENVQGDERDHIIFSIGYGPTTATGVVHNRFGPVNAEGGHRRLNVAVSRARRSMTVVHSLRPEDITSQMKGALLLRRYLEFIRLGEAAIEGAVDGAPGGEAESPFEDAVGRALMERGYRIQRQVGCAKFSIDLAVLAEDGNGFDLAVECDGATYHRSPSARDRDRLRQEILERLGWRGRIHRVWSTAWIQNPEAELERIVQAINASRSSPRGSTSAVPNVATDGGPVQPAEHQEEKPAAPMVGVEPARQTLSPYEYADLREFRSRLDIYTESAEKLAKLVEAVVAVESPVHEDLVVERIRNHYGLARAGSQVRTAIERGIGAAVRHSLVYWIPASGTAGRRSKFLAMSLTGAVRPRGQDVEGKVRNVDQIADPEIEATVRLVVAAMGGAGQEDIVVATARAFGYSRTGETVETRLRKCIQRMVSEGRLIDRLGSLVVA